MEEDRGERQTSNGKSKINSTKMCSANIDNFTRRTHFNSDEVRALMTMYQQVTQTGNMDRLCFRKVVYKTFDITDDFMLDRVFRVFDTNADGIIQLEEWILGLSTILKGSLEEHIAFCYDCYDINSDRSLAREELFHCLKNCLIRTAGIEEDIEESIKDIVEISMRKLDLDKDGQITFSDYRNAIIRDPLILEICGPCLPQCKARLEFLSTFVEKYEGSNSKKARSQSHLNSNSVRNYEPKKSSSPATKRIAYSMDRSEISP